MDEIDKYAKIIWDYMLMHQKLEPSDLILTFGSRDLSIPERAAELFLQGLAPVLVFSGYGYKFVPRSEAEVYAEVAVKLGVPKEKIFIEDKSMNTGENILFSKDLIIKNNLPHKRIILVQKPYMERRIFAAFRKQWPEPQIIITSPQVSYEDYVRDNLYYSKEKIINTIVGDLQRIKEYPKLGFQIEQEIPEKVWEAYEKLQELGFNKRPVK